LDDLRLTTFWSTYHIWTKHQTLNRTFWKIIPECCKIEKKHKKPDLLGKRKRRNKKLIFEDCKNPFHYLPLKKDLEPIKGTCSCSVLLTRRSKKDKNLSKTLLNFHHPQPHLDLKNFSLNSFDNKNNFLQDISGLDHKHTPENRMPQLVSRPLKSKTSGDIAREQQDRKKRFKQSLLLDFFGKN